MKDNWVPFYFESNQAFGPCRNKEDWEEIKGNYLEYWEELDLSRAMITQCNKNKMPNFGFRIEHTGDYSLLQFSIDNDMKL